MKTVFITSLATLCSIAIAAASRHGGYRLTPDPEGQYPRLGACPDPHACILPPDVSQFLPGAYFDLRIELHNYDKDGNTTAPPPEPISKFKTLVRREHGAWKQASDYFGENPPLEHWDFAWKNSIEATYGEAKPLNVTVASRIWRKIKFDRPGTYEVKVEYGSKQSYTVRYKVVEPKKPKKKAKNAILFISDGTNVGMITAARALARLHTSGKYHDLLSFEDFDELGHVITNSVDGLVTDSANSASSYSTGHKSNVNALGVYADSSADGMDDPKVELVTELIRRRQPNKAIGLVSTAYGQDATPAAFYCHTRQRGLSAEITDQLLHGIGNWTDAVLPDVWLAGGAEYFKGEKALNGEDYYKKFQKAGYSVVHNKKDLNRYKKKDKLLGVFRKNNLDTWFERNLFVNNTEGNGAAPDMSGKDQLGSDQPGLADMTIKALEVLQKRGGDDGFFLMSEAASVDKQLHPLDFTRAWGELIELDVTVKKTVQWLKDNGEYEDTLIIVTADHSHGFDVWGSVDRDYIVKKAGNDKAMRQSVGTYATSGWPGYFDQDGDGFPDNWNPQITLAAGTNNGPDHFESFLLGMDGTRSPAVASSTDKSVYVANKKDQAGNYGQGIEWHGNLPVSADQGVHSLADVFIYSNGPGSENFKKTIENWEVFYGLTQALDLQRPSKHEK